MEGVITLNSMHRCKYYHEGCDHTFNISNWSHWNRVHSESAGGLLDPLLNGHSFVSWNQHCDTVCCGVDTETWQCQNLAYMMYVYYRMWRRAHMARCCSHSNCKIWRDLDVLEVCSVICSIPKNYLLVLNKSGQLARHSLSWLPVIGNGYRNGITLPSQICHPSFWVETMALSCFGPIGQHRRLLHICEHHWCPPHGVIVWATICYECRMCIVFVQGSVTGHQYVTEILWPPFTTLFKTFTEWYLQHQKNCINVLWSLCSRLYKKLTPCLGLGGLGICPQ